jgi:hypothetical protein
MRAPDKAPETAVAIPPVVGTILDASLGKLVEEFSLEAAIQTCLVVQIDLH